MTNPSPESVVRRHIELYSDGTPDSYGSDRFLSVWAEDCVQEFLPSAQFPQGAVFRGKESIRPNLAGVSRAFRNRRLDVHDLIATGERVAVRHTWSAVAAVDLPSCPAGETMRLECADFYTVKDGLITHMVEIVGPPLSPNGATKVAAP
ncbi:MAG: nuclear transport factor 2 family protein [Dehalococcoidia bacterium]|nr:MAG: nuclear transport factor 2 family protein [bacterium]MCE7928317.1 nuclear transport factor 2 family protein [Chloroflexi bacterium CFX7]MCK6565748.1 nuclear transport factor 2 family protein [Dehalococcoidia bacterium]MCL4232718.1 nuclear transport factor 2 family protein [Dehalococcoidia bacterium]NUQ54796.1 nuclear transport factor 2 family protein [Dehalococcoidia bacterium]